MDIATIITAINTIAIGILGWLGDRRMKRAEAVSKERTSETDYTGQIIKQAEERVSQLREDKERAIAERDAAYAESKGQRKSKQEWRDKFFEEQKTHHATQIALKDLQAQLREERFHRCEINGCTDRKPPRKREHPELSEALKNQTNGKDIAV